MATRSAGDTKTAQAELQLFLESLVDDIQKRAGTGILQPIFDGFDWRESLRGLRSGLADDNGDWKFRFWLTLLLAELLIDRYEHRA